MANHVYKTIGIVRDVFDKGDLRTDADGTVFTKDLSIYDPKKQHTGYHIAPSTKKELGW